MTRRRSPRKRPPEEPEKENSERWLITYADLLTLLFAFFVVLYSMSQVDPKKFDDLSQAFQVAFLGSTLGNPEASRTGPKEAEDPRSVRLRRNALRIQLESRLKNRINEHQLRISEVEEGIRVSLFSDAFFTPGSPEVSPETIPFLGELALSLRPLANPIRVEGHTDGSVSEGDRFGKEWQLSTERALSVLNLLFAYGYPEARASVAGYGSTRPVATNLSPEGRAFNRRVDILVLWDRADLTGRDPTPGGMGP